MAAWIGTAAGASPRPPILEHVDVVSEARHHAIGLRVAGHRGAAIFLFHPGADEAGAGRECTIADYQTDARVFHYACDDDRLTSFGLVDGTHALAVRDGWISIAASGPLPDLSGVIAGDTLDLHTTAPPPEMRVHGGALWGVSRITLNGREVPRPEREPSDTLAIGGAGWGVPVRDLLPHAHRADRVGLLAL